MEADIPDFLIEMSKQMNTQDNRITADPMWQVRCKRTRVTADTHSDMFDIYDSNHSECIARSSLDAPINEQILEHYPEAFEEATWISEWSDEWGMAEPESTLEEKAQDFIDNFNDYENDLPEGVEQYWIEEYEDVVTSHLTEADAKAFIKRKQHDYPPLYTYVTSMYFCPQMKELRNWIMSLTKS